MHVTEETLRDALIRGGELARKSDFDAACRLAAELRPHRNPSPPPTLLPLWNLLRQRHALWTYKDPNLRRMAATDDALGILDSEPDVETLRESTDQETLGLAGAIHKRRWEIEAQREHLERSAHYYLRSWAARKDDDSGYTGINAAFLLDLIADKERLSELPTALSRTSALQQEATCIRRQILAMIGPEPSTGLDWWRLATGAEAALGLGDFEAARRWLDAAHAADPAPWEWESTMRQLTTLAEVLARRDTAAGAGAMALLEDVCTTAAPGLLRGPRDKIGLALSGGGLRASLFHLGVLARLAETDVLRHVQVLSCVSGGSIVGAALYLRLLGLMEQKDDSATRDDYVGLVENLIGDFEAVAVGGNVRWAAFRALFRLASPTAALARALDSRLYGRIRPGKSLRLRDLKLREGQFNPRRDNWRRRAKLPELLINATSVNTGHNWQYSVSWMGEPPYSMEHRIDSEERLRRLYHHDAPESTGDTTLGEAVASSASVPLFFPARGVAGLYPDRTVRLVDGGVADNQGTFGLDEQDCTAVIVSDASAPATARRRPFVWAMIPPSRVTDMMMTTIRRLQYRLLGAQERAGRMKHVLFLHLSEGLESAPVDWESAKDPKSPPDPDAGETDYGVPRDMQRAISRIRTDLDRFSRDEAHALIYSGYAMTRASLVRDTAVAFCATDAPDHPWAFLEIGGRMALRDARREALLQELRDGDGISFVGLRRGLRRLLRRLRGSPPRADGDSAAAPGTDGGRQ
ncbi:MAG: hypothetical protein AMXMBFR64_17770 [Myxococcales bacterium]